MSRPKILIVDDVPENISVLFEFMSEQGYEVSIAPDGESALEVVTHNAPDLILLDVMMPGIDGFETCRRLKAEEAFADIPVVFMTALSDTVDKVRGFGIGAVDYITKPVQQDEVLSRVRAHLTIHRLQQELQQRNQRLAERNAELAAFAHTIAHDLRNPLGAVRNGIYLLHHDLGTATTPAAEAHLGVIEGSVTRMAAIIEGLLTLAGLTNSEPRFEPLRMGALLAPVLEQMEEEIAQSNATIHQPEEWPIAWGHPTWVDQIWTNYISNALKYAGPEPRIELGAEPRNKGIRFWVRDHGHGLSKEERAGLFTPFNRLHERDVPGSGLGLSIVQRIAQKLGGEVGVESPPGGGSLFYFTLPAQPPGG